MPKNKKENINERLSRVSELYLKGYTQIEIGNIVNVTHQQVSYDLKKLMIQWKENQLNNIDEWISAELVRINKIETEAWEAWERSKGKDKSTKIKGTTNKANYIEKTESENFGDPRYFNTIQWCINKRAELIGLNAPLKQEIKSDVKQVFVIGGQEIEI